MKNDPEKAKKAGPARLFQRVLAWLLVACLLLAPLAAMPTGTAQAGNANCIVALDPGHGGNDPGAIAGGINEKDINWAVSNLVSGLLAAKGYTVILSRAENTNPSFLERVMAGQQNGARLLVSIHSNSFTDPAAFGTEAWYQGPEVNTYATQSAALGTLLAGKVSSRLGLSNRGVKVGKALYADTMPSALIEMAFLSNPTEREMLLNRQPDFANAIADAIHESLGSPQCASSATTTLVRPTLSPAYGEPICGYNPSTGTLNAWKRYTSSDPAIGDFYLTLSTNDGNDSSNSATWAVPGQAGTYRVEAFIASHGPFYWTCLSNWYVGNDTSDAHYFVTHDGVTTGMERDQKPVFDGWINLGEYYFRGDGSESVRLSDLNDEAIHTRTVSFSVMRFTLLSSDVSGRIVDSAGYPIAGISVSNGKGQTAVSNANGDYAFSGLPAGQYTFAPSKAGYQFSPAARAISVPPGASGLNFTATNRFAISGKVMDNAGTGLAGVPVSISNGPTQKTAKTDNSGRYAFSDLPIGLYILRAPLGSTYQLTPRAHIVWVPPNTSTRNFTTTPQYGKLAGKITVQGSGAALADAQVSVAGQVARSDAEGKYAFDRVLPGTHEVAVTHTGYAPFKGTVEIQANQTSAKDVALKLLRPEGYRLPFPGGTGYFCTQGNAQGTHVEALGNYAFDFGTQYNIIVASRYGRVVANTYDRFGGHYVLVRHEDGYDSLYLHMSEVWVSPGQWVQSGQAIGRSGFNGLANGPHVHTALYPSGTWSSVPLSYLDVTSNGGVPTTMDWYNSDNYQTAGRAVPGEPAAPPVDDAPPSGDVQLRLAGANSYELRLQATDYVSDVTHMRLATTPQALDAAAWEPYTVTRTWADPVVFVQYQDTNQNISAVYSDTLDAIAFEPIQAAFTLEPQVCVNEPLVISNQSTSLCEQCGWLWDFGNGQTSEAIQPEYNPLVTTAFAGYETPGTYTVKLSVTNMDSTSSASHTVTALPLPAAGFTIHRVGAQVMVAADLPNAAGYTWNFGDGASASGPTATHTYTDPSKLDGYVVTLQVTSSNGCSSSTFQYLPEEIRLFLPISRR